MANNGSAELKPGLPLQVCHGDKSLFRREDCSADATQPMLRIVYSADSVAERVRAPSPEPSLDMNTSSPRRPNSPPARDGPDAGMLDRTVQAQIGRLLRDVFADVAGEPVPERFITLLAALECKENSR